MTICRDFFGHDEAMLVSIRLEF